MTSKCAKIKKDPRKAFMERSHSMWYHNVQRYREELGMTKIEPFPLDFFRAQVEKALNTPCPYCSDVLKIDSVSLDHAIPTSRADEFAATLMQFKYKAEDELFARVLVEKTPIERAFSWENTCLCCKRCNRAKGDLTSIEFRMLRDFISTLPTKASKYIYTKLSSVPMRFFGKSQNKKKKTSVVAQPGEDF